MCLKEPNQIPDLFLQASMHSHTRMAKEKPKPKPQPKKVQEVMQSQGPRDQVLFTTLTPPPAPASPLGFQAPKGLDPAWIRDVGQAQMKPYNPFIIILPRRETVNQRDNPPANKLPRGVRGGEG